MAIPGASGPGGCLPPGEYLATMEEVRARYATNFRRREIFNGLQHVVGLLTARRVRTIWIDGSFICEKIRLSDVDVFYDAPPAANTTTWDWLSPQRRGDLKRYHRVDLWLFPSPQPVPTSSHRSITIKQFFETDRDGLPKGIIRLDLGSSS